MVFKIAELFFVGLREVYADKPEMSDALKESIWRVIDDIRFLLLQKSGRKLGLTTGIYLSHPRRSLPRNHFKNKMANSYFSNKAKFLGVTLNNVYLISS